MVADTLSRFSIGRFVLGVLAATAVVLFIVAGLLGDAGAARHARFHAMSAIASLLVAFAIMSRWSRAGLAAAAPALGLAFFASAQLVESVGALGYDTIRDTRSDLAVAHDLGLGLTALGMLSVVGGLAIGIGLASTRTRGAARVVGGASALAVAVFGLLFIKVLIGM